MIRLLVIRHAPTEWTLTGRLQGRTDTALAPEAADYLAAITLPPPFDQVPCYASPLRRAMETAQRLGRNPVAEDSLIEMDWGAWEGLSFEEASARLDPSKRHFGLDYAAPGGESPREVQNRLLPFLDRLDGIGGDGLAVSHKGVIRALYALAVGWTMDSKPPDRLDFKAGQLFALDQRKGLQLKRLNVPLNGQPA
ncbi:MAG: histidine phosphatase family protein [Pseudomonadota bacterium]